MLWATYSRAYNIKNRQKDIATLPGWEILTMVSDLLSHNLTCPQWLLTAFNNKIGAVLYGSANNFGHKDSFGCWPKKRTRQRDESGICQDVVKIASSLIADAGKVYKISKDQPRPSRAKTPSRKSSRKKKILVFEVMANYCRLIRALMKHKIMTASEIAANSNRLKEISKLNSDTLYNIYYNESQKLQQTF
ncbi:hypothetical protein EOM81_13085 [bacterium]|nr:hypothetical protein [bacterium]